MSDYGLKATDTLIAGTGGVFFASPGAAFPESITDPIDTDVWTPTGLTEEDGVSFKIDPNEKDFGSWQTTEPTRRKHKGSVKSFTANLQQISADNLTLCEGGQVVGDTGDWTYHPPADGEGPDEHAFLLEVVDGDRVDRLCFYRGIAKAAIDTKFNDDTMSAIPLEVTALAPNGLEDPDYPGRSWFWQSNSDAFGPADADTV